MMLSVLTLGLLASTPLPHPVHHSFAEVDCNVERRELQVSMAMWAIDFEEALSRRAGKRVNLDTTKGVETIIESYLADRFIVTLADESTPKPRYFGREDNGKTVWIYFTVSLAAATRTTATEVPLLTGVRLKNRVLMEITTEQRNTVELREGRWRRFLKFERADQERTLRSAPPPKSTETPPKPDAKGAKARSEQTARSPR